jgi:hypothetical protein
MWVLLRIERSVEVQLGPRKVSKELAWQPGMIGVLPVFDSRDAAVAAGEEGDMIFQVSSVLDDVEGTA